MFEQTEKDLIMSSRGRGRTPGATKSTMTIEEAVHRLMTRPCINVWPELGLLFGVGRNEAYEMVRRGEIEAIAVGRLRKPISAPIRRKLKIDEAA